MKYEITLHDMASLILANFAEQGLLIEGRRACVEFTPAGATVSQDEDMPGEPAEVIKLEDHR